MKLSGASGWGTEGVFTDTKEGTVELRLSRVESFKSDTSEPSWKASRSSYRPNRDLGVVRRPSGLDPSRNDEVRET